MTDNHNPATAPSVSLVKEVNDDPGEKEITTVMPVPSEPALALTVSEFRAHSENLQLALREIPEREAVVVVAVVVPQEVQVLLGRVAESTIAAVEATEGMSYILYPVLFGW